MVWTVSRTKVVALLVVALVGGWLAYRYVAEKRGPSYEFIEVRRGDVIEEVSETGKVVPATETDLFFKSEGRVAAVLVTEGQAVSEGQAAARLDTMDLLIKEREARAALRSAFAKYEQALAGATEAELKVYRTAVANAEENLAKALASAAAALAGKYDTARVTARASTSAAVSALTDMDGLLGIDDARANDALEANLGQLNAQSKIGADAAYIEARGAIAAAKAAEFLTEASPFEDIDRALPPVRAALEKTIAALDLVKTMLDYTTTGTSFTVADLTARKVAINADRTSVVTALANFETAAKNILSTKAANDASVASVQGALATAKDQLAAKEEPLRAVDREVFEAAVAAAQAGLDLVRQLLDDATLRAPAAGVITAVDVERGELVTPARRVAALISSGLEIEADVSELDIRKIAVGMSAAVTFDALGPTPYDGKVLDIAPREKLKDEDIFYRVTVVLDDPLPELRSGMTADLSFTVGEKSGVLVVPERLVSTKGGRAYVRAFRGGKVAEVAVTVGLRGVDVVEIAEGLGEGEKIVVRELD